MLLLVTSIKLVVEIALMAFAGQWLLGLLAGKKRDTNVFYQLLKVMTDPFVKGMRWITPRVVIDRHVPLATFLVLTFVWLFVTAARIQLCLGTGVNLCR